MDRLLIFDLGLKCENEITFYKGMISLAFMNARKRNKTATIIMVVLISAGLLASVSIGYFTGFTSTPVVPNASAPITGSGESVAVQNFQNGSSLLQQGKTEEAAKFFEEARKGFEEVVKNEPKNIQSLGDLATSYFYLGQTDKAIETANKALAVEPKFTNVRLNLARYLFYGKNNALGALNELKQIEKGDVNYAAAQQLMTEINKSKSLPPGPLAPSNGSATTK